MYEFVVGNQTTIRALPPLGPEPGASRSAPEIEADYFTSNAERIRYPTFRTQGMHIGSGIAEAACKMVVSTRAKRSGMRWTPAGLDTVLALRIAVLNQAYNRFWAQHSRLAARLPTEFIHPKSLLLPTI